MNPNRYEETEFTKIPSISTELKFHIIIIDFETTGLNIEKHGIIQISAKSLLYDKNVSMLINLEYDKAVEWTDKAINITGIHPNDILDCPSIYSVIKDFENWSTNGGKLKPILIAHNANFDQRFFNNIYKKVFPDKNTKYLWVDSLRIFDKVEFDNKSGKSASLEALALHYLDKSKVINLHDAESDVEILSDLLYLKFSNKENIIKYCVDNGQEKLQVKRKISSSNGKRACKKCGLSGHYQKTCINPPKIENNVVTLYQEDNLIEEDYGEVIDNEFSNDESFEPDTF